MNFLDMAIAVVVWLGGFFLTEWLVAWGSGCSVTDDGYMTDGEAAVLLLFWPLFLFVIFPLSYLACLWVRASDWIRGR